MLKHLLRTADLTRDDMLQLLELSAEFKRDPFRRRELLSHDSVVLYFNKPSTRTRISFETAVGRLGGDADLRRAAGRAARPWRDDRGRGRRHEPLRPGLRHPHLR